MDMNPGTDRSLVARYEAVFCLSMAALAYLWRDNPAMVYPEVLYRFLALMILNLAAGVCLRLSRGGDLGAAAFILGNCAVVTSLLKYSGGPESNLWVLYLLPVFTSGLLLGGTETALITAGAAGFNLAFLASSPDYWDAAGYFGAALKTGILILAGVLTWRQAQRERAARAGLEERRAEAARLAEGFELQKARLEETRGLAEVGLLGSGMAHDLGNTFCVILGFIDVLDADPALSSDSRRDLGRIMKAALLGKGIVAQFAGMAKARQMPEAPCDLNEIIESILALEGPALAAKGIAVERSLAERLPIVLGKRTQLQRVFLNLITNALGILKRGDRLTLRTQPEAAWRAPGVRVTVEDTGPGIPDAVLLKLFKPFATGREEQGGTGLGLYVAAHIAAQHGGLLVGENREDGGARFILHLPVPERALELAA